MMDRASMHRQCLTMTSELPETLGGSYENYCCTVLTSSCSLFLFVASSAYSPRISSSRRCALIISFDAPRILGWSATGVGHGRGFRFRSCNNASTMRCGTACRSITVILSRVWRLNALEMMRSRTSQPPVVAVDPSVRGGAPGPRLTVAVMLFIPGRACPGRRNHPRLSGRITTFDSSTPKRSKARSSTTHTQ